LSDPVKTPKRWYQVKMVWVVLIIPLVAVVLSMGYMTLSVVGADTTVRDDWYMDGKALQQDLSRDKLAAKLKLNANLNLNLQTGEVELKSEQPIAEPLKLIFSHAADKAKDFTLELPATPYNKQAKLTPAQIKLLETPNKFYVELSADQWRLRQIAMAPDATSNLLFTPLPAFTQLFEQ